MRAFIALDLPEGIRNAAVECQEVIKKQDLFEGTYPKPENLHLTLKFLGEIDLHKLEAARKGLKKLEFVEFDVMTGNLGVFTEKDVRIVWLSLEASDIAKLHTLIDSSLEDLFPTEVRFFNHITLARVKKNVQREKLIRFLQGTKPEQKKDTMKSFSLQVSTLGATGPSYEVVDRHMLLDRM